MQPAYDAREGTGGERPLRQSIPLSFLLHFLQRGKEGKPLLLGFLPPECERLCTYSITTVARFLFRKEKKNLLRAFLRVRLNE